MKNTKVLGMLSLPLIAIAALAVFLSVSLFGNEQASANQPNAALEYELQIGAANTAGDAKGSVDIAVGSTFSANAALTAIPAPYDAIAVTWNYSGVIDGQFENAAKGSPDIVWPDCGFEAAAPPSAGSANAGCGLGISSPSSNFLGVVGTVTLTCLEAGVGQVSLLHGPADTLLIDNTAKTSTDNGPDVINVNCVPATATPTTPPTATPPDVPPVFKKPALSNEWLERQGTKVPPARCDDSTDVATLTEQFGSPIGTLSPKGEPQTLAAFEFEVRFDWTKVCVNLAPTQQWQDLIDSGDAICFVQDKDSSTLEGIARIGCVTIGKGFADDLAGLDLATIEVRPQPELYSVIRPNQDNGQAIQIMNQGCELADEQGHAVPIFSCEDADITFRFLEGDVDGPDCDVDVLDTQQVAFRWGVNKGSLLYNSFMDLEPSGQVKGDGDIDIKDIQFVFGRFGSTCAEPHPPQPPVNPKA